MKAAILFSFLILTSFGASGQNVQDNCILHYKRITALNLEIPSKQQRDLFDPFRITHMLTPDMLRCKEFPLPGKPTSCAIVIQSDSIRSIHLAYEQVNTDSLFTVVEKTLGHYDQRISYGIEGDQDHGIGGSSYAWNLSGGKVIVITKEFAGASTLLYSYIVNKQAEGH